MKFSLRNLFTATTFVATWAWFFRVLLSAAYVGSFSEHIATSAGASFGIATEFAVLVWWCYSLPSILRAMNHLPLIIASVAVLCSSALAQSGWQSVAPPISPQVDETPHCRIHVADGSTGSGTLVCRGARSGYVVTCSHLFSESQAGIVCQFPNGQQFGGTLAALDKANDLAVVQITPRPEFAGAPLSDAQPPTGIIACGFGPDGQFQARGGTVEREEDAQGAQFHHFIATAPVRPGDSGGAVLDSQGRITGVVWGCRDNEVRFFAGAPFFRIISEVSGGYGKVQLAQCQGGRCYGGQCYGGNYGPGAYGPGMVSGPIYQPQPSRPTRPVETEQQPAYQNPPPLQPTTPPMPTAQPCPCGPKWQDLESKLNQLTATLEAQQKFNTEITATVKQQNQTLTTIENNVMQKIEQKFTAYEQQHPVQTVPTAADVAEEINKNRVPARIRIVDPQNKFTTEYAEVRDGKDIDLIIDNRFTPAQVAP